MSDNPGRVVTVEVLASLVSEAYAGSFTPVNIMKGFKKTGVWPINPGEVTDRQLAPSKALCTAKQSKETNETANEQPTSEQLNLTPQQQSLSTSIDEESSPLFTPEREACYQKKNITSWIQDMSHG